jgi:UDP:flavonoid glycosyltransferase YjiC (YdhE family)
VRILFAFIGGNGHFDPLVPVARAARAAGHTVAVACGPSMTSTVRDAGFTAFVAGTGDGQPPPRGPLLPVDPEREDRDLREGFARRGARDRLGRLLPLCGQWRPDLIVCDEVDFGSMIAAERLGLPYASVQVLVAGSFIRPDLVAEPLDELRAEHGLPADPDITMLSRYLVLSPVPPSYRDPAFPPPPTTHAIRPAGLDAPPGAVAPAWLAALPAAVPTVYFTLGTVFNMESGDLFDRVLAGLRDLPVNLIVTVGAHIDPAEFGPQPDHVHIERYIPQALVLPRCRAVVSHGGSGSVIGALAHGVPMVLVPMGADQPHNAARCEDLGAARVLDPSVATPDGVREAVRAVLTQPGYRHAAERVRDEIAALPGPEHAVSLLETLAADRRPLSAGEQPRDQS